VSYTFRVIFDGVLAYVPDKPLFEKCSGKNENEKELPYQTCANGECSAVDDQWREVRHVCEPCEGCWKRRDDTINPDEPMSGPVRSLAVLMPDLRLPGTTKVPDSSRNKGKRLLNFPRFRDPHFPLLKFKLGDLRRGTTRRVDLVGRDISQQDECGFLFLRREQIRFTMKAENANSFDFAGWAPCPPPYYDMLPDYLDYLKGKGKKLIDLPDTWGIIPDLRDREQLESLWWLPDLARIVKNDPEGLAIKAREDCLPSYRGPFPDGLIARIECTGGRLRTYDFNRNVDGAPVKWSFAPPRDLRDTSWNRALANSLALEFFDVQDEVRIELRRLANEVVIEELVLAPGPGASRSELEIEITNREPDLLFQTESFNRSALPDMDFQPFYELLSQTDIDIDLLPIPYPHKESFFGVVEKPCAGTGMAGTGTSSLGTKG
jgi:hypothetical protein